MADSENNKEGGVAVPAATTEETSSSSFTDSASKWMSSMTVPTTETTWKLPDGIEDHIESGLVKAAIGGTVGGIFGLIMFRSGRGMRAASIGTGLGVAAGSTYERIMLDIRQQQQQPSQQNE